MTLPVLWLYLHLPWTIVIWTDLALEALDQVANGHTGGDGMGIDDDVRTDPLTCERHVLQRET